MQSINIPIEDSLYDNLIENGINIQSKVKEFLFNLVDDGYPSIGTAEAKRRVADAVERYKNGTMELVPFEEGMKEIDNWLESL